MAGSPTQYIGRAFDILALQGAQAVGTAQLADTLFNAGNSGEICTGVQRLAQSWVMEFFTIIGSMPLAPTRGTGFLLLLQQGDLLTPTDVTTAYNIAAVIAYQNLKNDETVTTPLDEQLASTELTAVTLGGGALSMSVTINSNAGTSRAVILPLDTLVN